MKELISEDQINLGDFQQFMQNKFTVVGLDGCIYTLDSTLNCMDYTTPEVDCFSEWVITDKDCSGGGGGTGGCVGCGTDDSGSDETGGLNGSNGGTDIGDGFNTGESSGVGGPSSDGSNSDALGGVPVGVLPSHLDIAIDNFFDDLTDQQKDCLNASGLIKGVRVYLENNMELVLKADGTPNTDAQDFAIQAIDAVCEGGEVDFVNELIFSNEFKQTKAYCVIKLLTETNNNLFQDVISQFTSNNSKKRLRFLHEPIYLTNGGNDITTEANTSPPDPLGITTIRFNSNTNSANANSLEIAGTILHEAIHAELFRIVEGGNNVPEPLPQDLYNMMVYFLEYYENNGSPQFITSNAQHTFMANNYVGAIANAVRNFDNNTHPLDNYMSFGWEGLSQIGISTQPTPLVTMQEINNYYVLAGIPLNDNHNLSCDE